MYDHTPISVLLVDDGRSAKRHWFIAYLINIPHIRLDQSAQIPTDLSEWQVVVTLIDTLETAQIEHLTTYVHAGGGWLNLIGRTVKQIPSLFGAQPEPSGPPCELRVLFSQPDHPLSVRLPDAIYIKQYFHSLAMETDDSEMILYADWHFQHAAVLVRRPCGNGSAACTTLTDFRNSVLCQILYRVIRDLGGCYAVERRIGIGILGYAPSVGQYHVQGAIRTPGLTMQAACDLNPGRLQQAKNDFPDIRTHASADALGEDADVDLVIIATPPNTHARLALQMIAAGKHVICEKPLALNNAETAAMAQAAQKQRVHLSCHQNRRWDVDYLAINQALAEGLIGDLFYLETFVGGFSHPCGYWHSDATISGGMTYDWGAHYIDWIVGLCRDRVESVIGTRHKRVWHDVTNADQERIQIRFETGLEAEFIHSDIAAAPKPKWYLLGSQGAIVGDWQHVTEYQIDPVHYYHRHDIPATEMPSDLTIYRRHASGKSTIVKPALSDRPLFGFHKNLADHLLTGEPLVAPLADSMRVVAVLEAAARSMANDGRVEVLDV